MNPALAATVAAAAGSAPIAAAPLAGGCVGEVLKLTLADGRALVAKLGPGLAPEGFMLGWLAEHTELPVPRLLLADDDLLLMEYIEAGDPLDPAAERHAADLLAALHGHTADCFGFERDTVIGGLPQPNPWTGGWLEFFRDHRLLFMAGQATPPAG